MSASGMSPMSLHLTGTHTNIEFKAIQSKVDARLKRAKDRIDSYMTKNNKHLVSRANSNYLL